MVFKKLFGRKTYQDYERQGDTLLQRGRFADARIDFETACERLENTTQDPDALTRLHGKIATTGLELARLNLQEARFAFSSGAEEKGGEFLELAAKFSQEPEIKREIAEIMKNDTSTHSVTKPTSLPHASHPAESLPIQTVEKLNNTSYALDDDARYELLISPLPGDLPDRYRHCGKDFAKACLLSHDGQLNHALETFSVLHQQAPSDICLYEMAVIKAQLGANRDTEQLLKEALDLKPDNPLACLSLVQLYTSQKQFGEARKLLDRMLKEKILGNQVLIMLGDNAHAQGAVSEAESFYLKALSDKDLAKTAAERLVPIFSETGRTKERDFLLKKHCGKGCC